VRGAGLDDGGGEVVEGEASVVGGGGVRERWVIAWWGVRVRRERSAERLLGDVVCVMSAGEVLMGYEWFAETGCNPLQHGLRII